MLPNVHERELHAPAERVGALLDGLAGPGDRLWPGDRWPVMRLDRPLGVGARGGHGFIRYSVEEHRPGERVVFRFADRGGLSAGLQGTHRLEVEPVDGDRTILRHVIDARCRGTMRLKWPLVIEPLHDALLEDALDKAALAVGDPPRNARYSTWVNFLRAVFGRVRQASGLPG